MLTLKQRIKYGIDSALRITEPHICPNCGGKNGEIIDRKYLITSLIECNACKMLYRHPADKIETNNDFYQEEYEEADGITTSFLSKEELDVYDEWFSSLDFSNSPQSNDSELSRLASKLKAISTEIREFTRKINEGEIKLEWLSES